MRKTVARYVSQPIALFLARATISPAIITWSGFLLTISAAILIVFGNLLVAGFVVLLAGFFDILDGALARQLNRTSRFGAVLDSTLDRFSDGALFLGVLTLFLLSEEKSALFTLIPKQWSLLIVGLALLVSLLVSYIRARAEALGVECQTGLFTRAERLSVLMIGLWLGKIGGVLVIVLVIIVVFSFFTVGQRLWRVWQQTKKG